MLHRLFVLSSFLLSFLVTSCHHRSSENVPNYQYGFASRTIWIDGCVPHPGRIDDLVDAYSSRFDHCVRLPNTILQIREDFDVLATIPGRELSVSVKVWNTGIAEANGERIDPESPRETCYRQVLESLRFPEASCEQGYTVTWYPEGRVKR